MKLSGINLNLSNISFTGKDLSVPDKGQPDKLVDKSRDPLSHLRYHPPAQLYRGLEFPNKAAAPENQSGDAELAQKKTELRYSDMFDLSSNNSKNTRVNDPKMLATTLNKGILDLVLGDIKKVYGEEQQVLQDKKRDNPAVEIMKNVNLDHISPKEYDLMLDKAFEGFDKLLIRQDDELLNDGVKKGNIPAIIDYEAKLAANSRIMKNLDTDDLIHTMTNTEAVIDHRNDLAEQVIKNIYENFLMVSFSPEMKKAVCSLQVMNFFGDKSIQPLVAYVTKDKGGKVSYNTYVDNKGNWITEIHQKSSSIFPIKGKCHVIKNGDIDLMQDCFPKRRWL